MCSKHFRTKREMSHHMSADHKSYKICDYFKEGKCDVDGECRYNHEVLEQGQEICFKCGKKFKSKRDLRRHMKNYMAMKFAIDTYTINAQLGDAYSAISCQMHQMWLESRKER